MKSTDTKVTFDKGAANKYGDRVYTSKCGRFTIQRWEFNMPTRSVEYRLTDGRTDKTYKNFWSLADAKVQANEIANRI